MWFARLNTVLLSKFLRKEPLHKPTTETMKKRYALLSVSDKNGIVEFAKALIGFGYTLLSTGGTAKALRNADLAVTDVSDYTGFPECFDGRLKTLHPKVHGGILYRRDVEEDQVKAAELAIEDIDMVVVNLYPFQATIARGVEFEEAVEQIDIGGPAMLRSAAKNHGNVTVVSDPGDYRSVLSNLMANNNQTSLRFRLYLAARVFEETSRYDMAIGEYLRQEETERARIA